MPFDWVWIGDVTHSSSATTSFCCLSCVFWAVRAFKGINVLMNVLDWFSTSAVGVEVEFVIRTEVVFVIGVTTDEADDPVALEPWPLK